MSDNKSFLKPKRGRSPNGSRRDDDRLTIRGVSPGTRILLSELAERLNVPQGRVVDEAMRRLWKELYPESPPPKNTTSHPIRKDDLKHLLDFDWRNKPSTDPSVSRTIERIAERRRRHDESERRRA